MGRPTNFKRLGKQDKLLLTTWLFIKEDINYKTNTMIRLFKDLVRKKGGPNGTWTNEQKEYTNVHWWARNHIVKPCLCSCGKKPPVDLHNKNGTYQRKIDEWEYLCRSCHVKIHKSLKITNSLARKQ